MNSNELFARASAWRRPWAPAAVLCVRGEDALGFLQGQFSQDLRPAKVAAAAVYGLWLNHKGRVLADSFALAAGPAEVWLVSYFSAAAVIRLHLESHIIADDVVVEDCTAGWRGLALGGPETMAWLQTQTGAMPPEAGQFARMGEGFVFRGRRGAEETWEWLAPVSAPPPACDALTEISAAALEKMRLAAGLPAVSADIGPGDLPHEGGLDTAAVSYTKGCFLGQEVMARLRTGKTRRRLVRVTGAGEPPAARPALLFQGGKKIGELRSAVADGAGGFIGLALLTLLGLDAAAPLAVAPDGMTTIRLLDAP